MSLVCLALSSILDPDEHHRYLQEEQQPRQSPSACFCCCLWKYLWTGPLQADGFKKGPCSPWCAIGFSGQESCPLFAQTSASWSCDEVTCLIVELFHHPSCCGRVRGFLAGHFEKLLSTAWQWGAWLSSANCFEEVKWRLKHDCLAF